MPNHRFRIWCNMSFPAAAQRLLIEGTQEHELVFSKQLQASNLVAGQPDPQLEQAEIAFGQPAPELILDLPRLKWVHLTSAGYERYDRWDLRSKFTARGAALTNSSAVYSEPCAEHALAMMLALARQIPAACGHQLSDHAWPAAELRRNSRLLVGQSVLILGYGAIARRLIELLQPFRMRITCIRRTVKGDEGVPTFPQTETDRLLPSADHAMNILPGGSGTESFMSAQRFALMKSGAVFYNIGRGGTVDQDALIRALNERKIAAAYLDVTSPEPLPPDHPLWTAQNCHITPHTAGGHDDEHVRLVRHFLENLSRFDQRESLVDRVI